MADVGISYVPIQQESIQFNQPVASSSTQAIAAVCNTLLRTFLAVGSIVQSMLTEEDFQTQLGSTTTWVLADGRSVVGSTYQSLTGNANIPDLRGVFLRGKNNGRSDGNENPDGDLPLGTLTASKYASHTHVFGVNENNNANDGAIRGRYLLNITPFNFSNQTTSTGANDTAPKNTTLNSFIRIN